MGAGVIRPDADPAALLVRPQGQKTDRTVLAVDQFEELFTAATRQARSVSPPASRRPTSRTVVVLALRADFYGRCVRTPS